MGSTARRGRVLYHIKWLRFPRKRDWTFEPYGNFSEAGREKFLDFYAKYPNSPRDYRLRENPPAGPQLAPSTRRRWQRTVKPISPISMAFNDGALSYSFLSPGFLRCGSCAAPPIRALPFSCTSPNNILLFESIPGFALSELV